MTTTRGVRTITGSILALIISVGLLMATAGDAQAISAAVSPSTQSIASGQTATWGAAWGEQAPYRVTFAYGDGGQWSVANTNLASRGFSRTFATCTSRSYTQRLDVRENGTGASITAYATTSVSGGACR